MRAQAETSSQNCWTRLATLLNDVNTRHHSKWWRNALNEFNSTMLNDVGFVLSPRSTSYNKVVFNNDEWYWISLTKFLKRKCFENGNTQILKKLSAVKLMGILHVAVEFDCNTLQNETAMWHIFGLYSFSVIRSHVCLVIGMVNFHRHSSTMITHCHCNATVASNLWHFKLRFPFFCKTTTLTALHSERAVINTTSRTLPCFFLIWLRNKTFLPAPKYD